MAAQKTARRRSWGTRQALVPNRCFFAGNFGWPCKEKYSEISLMTPDWSRVTLEDVRRACQMYDSGAARPKRPARSTFLLTNGKTYPAKFIRGLAYRLATGVELDPNVDYSGGTETARFFQGLSLAPQHGSAFIPAAPAMIAEAAPPSPAQPVPPPRGQPSSSAPQRRQEPQKEALAALLRLRFGAVEREAKFPWLTVPPSDQMDDTILAIYHALQGMRGYSTFASFGKPLCCDFFVPAERLVIEYDERQHFTVQRAKSLELYPPDLALGFDRQEWLTACRTIRATDPTPPYRDEQRAFYDGLRDILAARNGVRLIRLRYGTFDWTGPGGEAQLCNLLASGQAPVSQPATDPTAQAAANPTVGQIRKVALVSHDYKVADSRGLYDYSEHFARVNKLCDEQGCDTILYALYTWDRDSAVVRNHDAIFGGLRYVQRVILEVRQPRESVGHVEVWFRGQQAPLVAHQRFGKSSEPDAGKQAFMNDLPTRCVTDGLLVLCGETNIASTVRSSDHFLDPYGFTDRLGEMNVGPILNPIHDYMTRYEMRKKRCRYSLGGRTVISVWNQGRRKGEAPLPWTVFHDGTERTEAVRELPRPFSDRPDIRIGVLDLTSL